jgi:hypothetical protein
MFATLLHEITFFIMKKFKVLLLFAAIAVAGVSCKKCLECEYHYEHGNHHDDVHEEKCGNKKDLEAFEKTMKAAAEEKGTTATCKEH